MNIPLSSENPYEKKRKENRPRRALRHLAKEEARANKQSQHSMRSYRGDEGLTRTLSIACNAELPLKTGRRSRKSYATKESQPLRDSEVELFLSKVLLNPRTLDMVLSTGKVR